MVKDYFKEHKDTLENRARTYKELAKRGKWIVYLGICIILGSMLFLVLSSVQLLEFDPFYTMIVYFVGLFIGSVVGFIGRLDNRRKGVPKSYFSADEQIFFKVFDALISLETFLKEKLEPARLQCLKELRKAHELIEYFWDPSQIGVVMREMGKEIEALKEDFDRNLIFTLEHGTETEKVHEILTEFGDCLIAPSKAKLVDLNERMSSLPRSEKPRPRYPMVDLLKRYQVHKHTAIVGLIFAIGLAPALFMVHYGHASLGEALIVFATIFGPSVGAYLNYVLKRR